MSTKTKTFVTCKIVHLGDHESATRYRVTCSDAETGAFVGSLSLRARAEGGAPPISLRIIAKLLDGHCLTSILIEVEAELWPLPPRYASGGSIPALPGIVTLRSTPEQAMPTGNR